MNKTLKKYRQKMAKTIILLLCGMLSVAGCTKDDTNSDLIASGTTGPLTWALGADGTLTISGKGEMPDYSSEFPSPWYEYRENISSVVIGNDVTKIGEMTFVWCENMTSVTIGNSVIYIGDFAFFMSNSLTKVINFQEIPQSLNGTVFRANRDLFSITLLAPATSIEAYDCADVWKNFGRIGSIENPESFVASCQCECITDEASGTTGGLTWSLSTDCTLTISGNGEMPDYDVHYNYRTGSDIVFTPWAQNSVTSVVIENGVTSIGSNAFRNLADLTSVSIPNSVLSIGGSAFSYCARLMSVNIPNSVISIGCDAFSSCKRLSSINIPNSVTSLGMFAFVYSGLTSITIPNSLTNIEERTFGYCRYLKTVTIPNSVTSIERGAFYGSSVTEIINQNTDPQMMGIEVFSLYSINAATLFVPSGSERNYRAAEGWKDFVNIKEIQ